MIIQPFSDLHVDFKDYKLDYPVSEHADVVVYAGDIGENIEKNFEWMAKQLNGKKAVYILGNHEFYRGKYYKKIAQAEEVAEMYPNIYFIEKSAVTIEGIHFVGGTLWTDFNKANQLDMINAQFYMNDFKAITYDHRNQYYKFKPLDALGEHRMTLKTIETFLKRKDTHRTVVVTHHAPSAQSVDNKFKSDMLNSAYYSDLDKIILEYQPNYWIHGHMHDAKHYKIGKTSVVCNPGGYPDFETGVNGFNEEMLLNV